MATPTNITVEINVEMTGVFFRIKDKMKYVIHADMKTSSRFIKKLCRLCKRYGYELSIERELAEE